MTCRRCQPRRVARRPGRNSGAPEARDLQILKFSSVSGHAPRIPQDQAHATYAPKLNREAGKIDWNESAEAIERKIRAYNPWPSASTEFDGRSLKIFAASIVDLRGQPGELLRHQNELVIASKDRALSLREIQLEGKRRMSAAEFLRGLHIG